MTFSGYKRFAIDHSKMFFRDKARINGIEWLSFAKEKHAKYHKP